jgi:hypothetical protein
MCPERDVPNETYFGGPCTYVKPPCYATSIFENSHTYVNIPYINIHLIPTWCYLDISILPNFILNYGNIFLQYSEIQ